MNLSRRHFLAGTAALAGLGRGAAAQPTGITLTAAPARAAIVPGQRETEVWSYNGTVPGPVLRFRQGERVRIAVENRLDQETTAHWHGVRVPNGMDGVPHLTQPPIAPGAGFVYEFGVPDAGTFWYHPHARSSEQVERGLAGAFIVDEAVPPDVDRDMVWVLDDWRLTPEAAVAGEFGNFMDASHAGRIGNTITINGVTPLAPFPLRPGERLRLRLVNAANARIFGLEFGALAPLVIALDGHPVEPHPPAGGRIVLGPAMRADIILDGPAASGETLAISDTFYRQRVYKLADFAVDGSRGSVRPRPLPRLTANPLSQPDLARADRHVMEFGGGMMDPRLMRAIRERGGQPDPDMLRAVRERMAAGHIWSINGQSVKDIAVRHDEHRHEPLLTLAHGRSYILAMHNDTAWHHPMHLHGMTFRVLTRNGVAVPHGEWRDTALLDPGERVEIAFVADNPGDWMFHCHVLEHQEAGMMGTFRVA